MINNLAADARAFSSNVFLVEGDREVLVDAGANFDVVAALEDHDADPDALVITHTHSDHVENAAAVRSAFEIDSWGFDPTHPAVTHGIEDERTIQVGDHDYRALHTPGHKNDHLCFYAADPGILFAGDLIFQNGAFGRTDLREGDRTALIESIDRVREVVSESLTELHAGHGPSVEQDPVEHVEMAARAARQR